ncbi:MAG: histidine phosphatase family protein, partial [Candidatus Promineifilaceae bacterium]
MNHTLLLVRHSSVAVQPEKPAAAWPLSADGRVRAQTFAQTLNSLPTPITRVITSQEPKAIETGAIMAA